MHDRVFDPLAALTAEGCRVRLDAGRLIMDYGTCSTATARRRAGALVMTYEPLLRLQLDVPPGEQPRTVRQLLASGRIEVREGRYRLRG
ncbi:MAG: hypothetical protein RDU30_09840 [Desulfovibrionaceae bacterium]|nr:hypothetical protein [Desulfovibrionaceae bacterium]